MQTNREPVVHQALLFMPVFASFLLSDHPVRRSDSQMTKACIELSFEDLSSFSVHVNVWIGLYMKVYSPRHGCDVKLVMSMEGIIDK
jgi:hypothetical protein